MSIIGALVWPDHGVICSDGRRFGSACVRQNGSVVQPAQIERDNFDKTFELDGERGIGAFCGLLSFGGSAVGDHIREIASALAPNHPDLAALVAAVRRGLKQRLERVDPGEVMFTERKVDVFLVGPTGPTGAEMRIYALRFCPSGNAIAHTAWTYPLGRKRWEVRFLGDGAAQKAATQAAQADLNKPGALRLGQTFVAECLRRAIEAGGASCGLHPRGTDPSCGGRTFTRSTSC